MADNKEIDDVSGVETTGHEWDGIKELNNPLPRWWLWTFYATIIWSIGYTIAYPAWPGLPVRRRACSAGRAAPTCIRMSPPPRRRRRSSSTSSRRPTFRKSRPTPIWCSSPRLAALRPTRSIANSATGRVRPAARAIRTSMTMPGSGAARSTTSTLTLMHGVRYEAGRGYAHLRHAGLRCADELLERDQIVDVAWYVRQIVRPGA